MWKDKLKGFLKNVAEEVKDAYEDVKEDVKEANIGEKLKELGEEIKEQFKPEDEANQTVAKEPATTAAAPMTSQPATAETEAPKKAPEAPSVLETADEECSLTVPAEDGERGEFSGMDEKNYSYLIPKDPGFSDEGNCHAFEIHQAYGYGKEVNYERDAMIYFSIAPEFDCEIKESRAKAAFTCYDGAPNRSKLMTVEHPMFTHVYLFENSKKYRLSYLRQISESELLGCELVLKQNGGDDAWKKKMIAEFKRFAGSCREV